MVYPLPEILLVVSLTQNDSAPGGTVRRKYRDRVTRLEDLTGGSALARFDAERSKLCEQKDARMATADLLAQMADRCYLEKCRDLLYPEFELAGLTRRRNPDGSVTVGITDHAQGLLGDMVFVELPKVGTKVVAGKECGVVESVKAAAEVYLPVAGAVPEVNEALKTRPERINGDPYGAGWVIRIKASVWSVQRSELHTGPHAVESYRAFLEAEGITCD